MYTVKQYNEKMYGNSINITYTTEITYDYDLYPYIFVMFFNYYNNNKIGIHIHINSEMDGYYFAKNNKKYLYYKNFEIKYSKFTANTIPTILKKSLAYISRKESQEIKDKTICDFKINNYKIIKDLFNKCMAEKIEKNILHEIKNYYGI